MNLHAARAAASEAAAPAVSPRVRDRCWLEDLNLLPLAYEASALPDELSQRCKLPKRDAAPLLVWKRRWGVRRGLAPRPRMDVHDVKERGAAGTVVTQALEIMVRARIRMRVRSRHMS
jgi:hypothetical protein